MKSPQTGYSSFSSLSVLNQPFKIVSQHKNPFLGYVIAVILDQLNSSKCCEDYKIFIFSKLWALSSNSRYKMFSLTSSFYWNAANISGNKSSQGVICVTKWWNFRHKNTIYCFSKRLMIPKISFCLQKSASKYFRAIISYICILLLAQEEWWN